MHAANQTTNQATIYVTNEAFQTSQTIKDLTNHERNNFCDEVPDLYNREGYHLKNANSLQLAPLPAAARVVLVLSLGGDLEAPQVSVPANLRGCIFEKAPDLPEDYADIVTYWSGPAVNSNSSGAAYYQCPLNAYMVDLTGAFEGHAQAGTSTGTEKVAPGGIGGGTDGATHGDADDVASGGTMPFLVPAVTDRLLSEGVVVAVTGLSMILLGLSPDDFIEIKVPIDEDMLGNQPEAFQSTKDYSCIAEQYERVFLKVADIQASPDRDRVFIDLLRNELLDYGYWY